MRSMILGLAAAVCLAGNHDLAVTGEIPLDEFSLGASLAAQWTPTRYAHNGAVDIAYRREVEQAADPAAHRAELIGRFRANINAFVAAEGFGIDDLIDPAETREVLLDALSRAPARHPSRAPRKAHAISPI